MTSLPALQVSEFSAFFKALNGVDPFPWQRRLLEDLTDRKRHRVEENPQDWPAGMALPTASGKTACIDIALFHMALQANLSPNERTAPRRVFFCVDRRVIVDEAHQRALAIAARLQAVVNNRLNNDDVLFRIALRLRRLAGGDDAAPLDVFQLRGGMYRDDAWATSPLQPTVICTTVDQLGSRLLFRGYGVSPRSAAIHAGLAANDALILLDEAHCAEPFRQTLDAVRLFRGETWSDPAHAIKTPFAFVEMSATPRSDGKLFELDDADRKDAELSIRLNANKQAVLRVSDYATATEGFAKELTDCALDRVKVGSKRIAVMVNRVDTARLVYDGLRQSNDCDAVLMIGRMRPLDRDELLGQWQPKLKATPGNETRAANDKPIVVVATQCLEVGANFDFDTLITEAASLDALRQRFGRLNRLGRDEHCCAVILGPKDAVAKDADDPIYGPAIAKTWEWLQKHAEVSAADALKVGAAKGKKKRPAAAEPPKSIDFGIAALDAKLPADATERADLLKKLSPPAPDAPVMLPAHLDLWCQTAPIPDPDPDVSLFLHGPQRGVPTVSVCWRADLGGDPKLWAGIVSLLPPSSPECMPVPLHLVKKWIKIEAPGRDEDCGDLEHAAGAADGGADQAASPSDQRFVLPWRGSHEQTRATNDANDLRPGDVVVVPTQGGGWSVLGHVPDLEEPDSSKPDGLRAARVADCAEQANLIARRKLALRLTPSLVESWPDPCDEANQPLLSARAELLSLLRDSEMRDRLGEPDVADRVKGVLRDLTTQLRIAARARSIGSEWTWLRILVTATNARALRTEVVEHPAGGFVVRSRRRIGERALRSAGLFVEDVELYGGDEDESSFGTPQPIRLDAHLSAVAERARAFADACNANTLADAVVHAAAVHDLGKLDPRFQVFLLGGPRPTYGWPPLGKSGRSPTRSQMRDDARRAGLPSSFRHEMLSMQLAKHCRSLRDGVSDGFRDLVLHLIASHHGHSRPLAPVVIDENPRPLPAFELSTDHSRGNGKMTFGGVDAWRRKEWEQLPAHRLDSGVCDRFWALTRRYGWWGLAYLEAILRLADRAVSREEQEADP